MFQKNFLYEFRRPSGRLRTAAEQIYCSLCRGELYPGDGYYLLENRRVCETCLERYAQHYFAPQHRRLSGFDTEVQ